MKLPIKKTKIVCTIGPSSQEIPILVRLIESGMNVARINFAHGDLATHEIAIANVRKAAALTGKRVAIMGDLPGPKMRIGELAEEPVEIVRGDPLIIQTIPMLGNAHRISAEFPELSRAVKVGDRIFLDDGRLQIEVDRIEGSEIHSTVIAGGELRSRKGMNFPGIDLGINAFTPEDEQLLAFAAAQGLDAVSQSFVEDADDIAAVRAAAAKLNYHPFLFAKIERAPALNNLDEILRSADGVMVARGDLGVEIPIEEIAVTQKLLIRRANFFGKPVITATHMLESMTHDRRPTRAEVTDVANAILDGTDCIMLSSETAIGAFPEDAVSVMTRIAQVTEPQQAAGVDVERTMSENIGDDLRSMEDRTALSVYHMERELGPAIIFTPSESGATVRRMARFKLPTWIVAFSRHMATCQALQFSYGVHALHVPDYEDAWDLYAREWCAAQGMVNQLALLTEGTRQVQPGGTTRISILYL